MLYFGMLPQSVENISQPFFICLAVHTIFSFNVSIYCVVISSAITIFEHENIANGKMMLKLMEPYAAVGKGRQGQAHVHPSGLSTENIIIL